MRLPLCLQATKLARPAVLKALETTATRVAAEAALMGTVAVVEYMRKVCRVESSRSDDVCETICERYMNM